MYQLFLLYQGPLFNLIIFIGETIIYCKLERLVYLNIYKFVWSEQFEAIKGVIRRQTIHWPKEKGQKIIYKALHRKLNMEQHEPKPGWIEVFRKS